MRFPGVSLVVLLGWVGPAMRHITPRLGLGLTCAMMTKALSMPVGFVCCIQISRCILSFSASSCSGLIQPWSRFMHRRERRWRWAAPTTPGTAATVSSVTAWWSYCGE